MPILAYRIKAMLTILLLCFHALTIFARPDLGDEGLNCPSKRHVDKVIGYYESWAFDPRKCDTLAPESLPLSVYTHINFAFATINPKTFEVSLPEKNTSSNLLQRLLAAKESHRRLEIWIAIGGYAFSEPDAPTFKTFSELAASKQHQTTFCNSLNLLVDKYHLDGVDIDWEFPGSPDRGGRPEDYNNLPELLKTIKLALRRHGRDKGLSIAVPVGFDNLRYFNIREIAQHVDWINIMSYDLHGQWEVPTMNTTKVVRNQQYPHLRRSSGVTIEPHLEGSPKIDIFSTGTPSVKDKSSFTVYGRSNSTSISDNPSPISISTKYETIGAAIKPHPNNTTSTSSGLSRTQSSLKPNATSITQPIAIGIPANSHTNLTELTNSIDSLLRQGVSPHKFVMGLAFYGRGFTLANSKCTTRGCPVKAVGTLGKCGDDPGILYNAEIRERIRERNLTITLDKNAAVELVNWDDEWISFDSERSFNIRANFARARGINAFMVWAMSHDDHKGTDSKALGKGLGLCV